MMGRSVHWMRPYVHYTPMLVVLLRVLLLSTNIYTCRNRVGNLTRAFFYIFFCSCSLFEMIQNEFSSRSHQDQFSYLSQGEEESIEFNSHSIEPHSIEQGTCFNVFVLLFNAFVLWACQCGRPRILILFKCVMFGGKQSTKLSNTSVF